MKSAERSAGIVVFRLNSDSGTREYLLLDYGKYWDYAKGHLEKDESDRDAALRELKEETGIDDCELIPEFAHEIRYFFRDNKRRLVAKTVIFFLGLTRSETVTISHEHVGYEFLAYEAALKKVTYANAREVLRRAEEFFYSAESRNRDKVTRWIGGLASLKGFDRLFWASMKMGFVISCLLFLCACAGNKNSDVDAFKIDLPGPTLAARVPEGYELKNRHVRVVIDGKTGDVVYFGSRDGTKNLLTTQPVQIVELKPSATTQPDAWFSISHSVGYVEARDDQTWQYLGEDSNNKIGWRKIYCLNGDDLNVSFLSQNRGDAETFCFGLYAGPDFSCTNTNPHAERFSGYNAMGTAVFHGFNEYHDQPSAPPLLLMGDAHLLRTGERVSWTMQWRCECK